MCLITLDNSVVDQCCPCRASAARFHICHYDIVWDAMSSGTTMMQHFVDNTKFTFPLAVIFAGCFWIAAVKILYPLGELTTSKYGHVDYPCSLPGNFGVFTKRQEITLTPFYAECAIIGAAIMWQMWNSTLPEALLKKVQSTFTVSESRSNLRWTVLANNLCLAEEHLSAVESWSPFC